MFINTFNVFFPHAIIVLSCKFPMLQLHSLYYIRCNSLPNLQQTVRKDVGNRKAIADVGKQGESTKEYHRPQII